MTQIVEQARTLPVSHTCDVAVCGGGVAGVAAALAAVRTGAKVLLLEREYALGGLATLGLITAYLPLCDGRGHQVSFGIAEELLRLSVVHGHEDTEVCPWLLPDSTPEDRIRHRFLTRYNPNVYAVDCERLLLAAGVEILYGTAVCGVQKDGRSITHLIVENKSGRSAVAVGSVVDATGDADVCARAGEETALFGQGNLLAAWSYHVNDSKYFLHILGAADVPDSHKTAEQRAADKARRFGGLDADELSEMVQLSHTAMLDDFLSKGMTGPTHALAMMPAIPQVRMTRRIVGCATQTEADMHREFADSVGLYADWRRPGPVYELSFATLYGRRVANLITAGRCISTDDALWDVARVIPVCAVSGQAAGIAAALSRDFARMDVSALQARLAADGVILHEKDLVWELRDTEWDFTFTDHDRQIARAIVFDESGNYYFVRAVRDDEFGKATLIETSGGGVEPGETPEEAIRRELKEELGVRAEIVCKISVVSDYYNLIHRHNINHYFLCRAVSFGRTDMTREETDDFHLSTLKMRYAEAEAEYRSRMDTKLGRLIANRELPVLQRAKELLEQLCPKA